MSTTNWTRIVRLSLALALAPVFSLQAAPPTVNGRIEQHNDVRIVRVWGTPQEMGFAHGHLLADEIAESVNSSAVFFFENAGHYGRSIELVRQGVQIAPEARTELQGVLEGMISKSGHPPMLTLARRPIELDDLILTNSIDMLRAFGCSGFTVWGERAGDAGLITTRNFDFAVSADSQRAVASILVREPNGLKKVASVAPPGYIGVFTGINEDGVCLFLHDGDGPRMSSAQGRQMILALSLKELAERASTADVQSLAVESLKKVSPYPFSYMVRVIGPRSGKDRPERVYRLDASGFGENQGGEFACITTNHYVGGDGASNGDSLNRYKTLERGLKSPMTSEAAWKALADVAASHPRATTLHSLVVYPEQRRLEIAFAKLDAPVVPAAKRKPTTLTFDVLFGKR